MLRPYSSYATSVSLDLHQVGIGIQCPLRDREHHPKGPRYRLGLPCLREHTEANQVVPAPAFPVELPAPLIEKVLFRNAGQRRSEEHTSELQSRFDLVCRLLLEKKK